MELSLKPRASIDWVKKTIANLLQIMRAVTNHNCAAFLKELAKAVVPNRVLKVRNNTKALKIVEVIEIKDNKVCINRRIVCEHFRVCAQQSSKKSKTSNEEDESSSSSSDEDGSSSNSSDSDDPAKTKAAQVFGSIESKRNSAFLFACRRPRMNER